jgi:hypothetical protein
MILLTLNVRGVGGSLKTASVRRVLTKVNTDIIFLQETLVAEDKAQLFMHKLVPSWHMCVVNSVGTSRGLLVTWDPNKFTLVPSLCEGGILLSGTNVGNNRVVNFLNVYGPCINRLLFWE